MNDQNPNAAVKPQTTVSYSETALREEGLKKENARIHLVTCEGCGDEPGTEFADGHTEKALVTKNESKRIEAGKIVSRCKACENEFKNRAKNSKSLIDFRRSVREINNILSKSDSYKLQSSQIKTLESELKFCIAEMRKALGSNEEVEKFIKA